MQDGGQISSVLVVTAGKILGAESADGLQVDRGLSGDLWLTSDIAGCMWKAGRSPKPQGNPCRCFAVQEDGRDKVEHNSC